MTSQADLKKLETAVAAMIEETVAAGKTLCLFDQHKLLLSLRVSSLKIRHVHAEIHDVLSGRAFCSKYGEWVTGERESDSRYLVRLVARRQPVEETMHFITHATPPREERMRSYTLEVPKGISEEQAQQLLTQACSNLRNSGNVADLHDEDLRKSGV